ncbi:MAG: hypothetical protein ACTSSH_07250 [Candidatus Heimdallarchaeota archaeon]
MATESKKKSRLEEDLVSIAEASTVFCSNCLFTWCSLRKQVIYCSLKYKGALGFVCVTGKCKK